MTIYVVDSKTGKVVPKHEASQSEAPSEAVRAHVRAEPRFVDHTLPRRRDRDCMAYCRCRGKGNFDRDAHDEDCQFWRLTRTTHLYPRVDKYGRPCFQSNREVDEFLAKAQHDDPKAAHLVYDRKGDVTY